MFKIDKDNEEKKIKWLIYSIFLKKIILKTHLNTNLVIL